MFLIVFLQITDVKLHIMFFIKLIHRIKNNKKNPKLTY